MERKIYKSKIGMFFVIVAVLIAAVLIGLFFLMNDAEDMWAIYFAYIMAGLAYFFSLILPFFNTKYYLKEDSLKITSGIYKKEILYKDILNVYKKKTLKRNPALDSRLIVLEYKDVDGTKSVGVSPKEYDEFFQNIMKIKAANQK